MKILPENIISKTEIEKDWKKYLEIIYSHEWKKYKALKEIIVEQAISIQETNTSSWNKLSRYIFLILWLIVVLWVSFLYKDIIVKTVTNITSNKQTESTIQNNIKEKKISESKVIDEIVISEKYKLEIKNYYSRKNIKNLEISDSWYKVYSSYKELITENYGEYYSLYFSEEEKIDDKTRISYIFIPFESYNLNFKNVSSTIEDISNIKYDLNEYKKIQLLWGDIFVIKEYITDSLDTMTEVTNLYTTIIQELKNNLMISESLFKNDSILSLLDTLDKRLEEKKWKLSQEQLKNFRFLREIILRESIKLSLIY